MDNPISLNHALDLCAIKDNEVIKLISLHNKNYYEFIEDGIARKNRKVEVYKICPFFFGGEYEGMAFFVEPVNNLK